MANENDLLELQVNDLDIDYEELLRLEGSLEKTKVQKKIIIFSWYSPIYFVLLPHDF